MQTENKQLISEQLARFVVWTKFEDIPEELVIKAQRHILDSVGAGIAGREPRNQAPQQSVRYLR